MPTYTKEQVIAGIRADRDFWRSLVDEVGRDRMEEPGPMGEWTFKDLAAHLAGWRNHRIAILEADAKGEPEPAAPWPADLDDDDPINEWIHDDAQKRSLDDVLADYDSTFYRLADALQGLPESKLADPAAYAWSGGEPLLNFTFLDHLHEEHLPSIRAWIESR
jgi:hypothetical protein